MTALRAALGAVAGGLEGAQQAEALRRKQKLEEENAAFSRASVLSSLGLRPTMVRDTEDPAARNVVSLEQPSFAPRGSSPALASALQQGMGVDTSARSLSKPTTMSTANPLTTALDTATTRMKGFERQQSSLPANPAIQIQLPVGRIGFRGPETPEEKAEQARVLRQELANEEAQKASAAARAKAEADQAAIEELVSSGMTRPQAIQALRLDAKYGDINVTPGVKATMRGQDISAATARQSQARADRDYALREKEFERREADSISRRERLPSGAQTKLAGLDSGVLMVGDVRAMLEQNTGAIGPIKGRMFRSILDANDKEGVGTRAAIEALSGEIRNQRFGQALTAKEAKYAESMLPNEKDAAETAFKKLEQLENFLERKREGIFRVHKQPYERINAAPTADVKNPYR
jgi:hypothetical protein